MMGKVLDNNLKSRKSSCNSIHHHPIFLGNSSALVVKKMMANSSPRLSRRTALAPMQAHEPSMALEEEGESLLMDMSLADLKKKTPTKERRRAIDDIDLDKLSQEELESLAWEAMEEEKRLSEKANLNRMMKGDDPMKNITTRRKSNSPRKMIIDGELKPLPKADMTGIQVRHTYDRQASPTRSALRRPYTQKNVAFGVVAEYEISREGNEIVKDVLGNKASMQAEKVSSSNSLETPSEIRSSSPLARFTTASASLSSIKTVSKATKGPVLTRRSSLRSANAMKDKPDNLDANKVTAFRKTSSRPSPKSAVMRKENSIRASTATKPRVKSREGASEVKPPNGFRLSSMGTLVAQTKCVPFTSASAPLVPRRSRRTSNTDKTAAATSRQGGMTGTTSKANPVPAWLKRRQDALMREEETRLERELERVRAHELGQGGEKNRLEKRDRDRDRDRGMTAKTTTQPPAYTSAVEKRITERAAWEAKRKAKEDLIAQEREKARLERLEQEEEEYRMARQRSIPRANPIPSWIRTRRGLGKEN